MIKYIDYNVIDFLEYREYKKGFDLNLYLNMDKFTFLTIYNKTAIDLDNTFAELVNLDKTLTELQNKDNLSNKEKALCEKYTKLGQEYYERYTFLNSKWSILKQAKKNKDFYTLNSEYDEYLDKDLLITLKDHVNLNKDDNH